MLNSECAYLGASPSVGAQTKQESISSQPGCLFSQNCTNSVPLETSVPLSDLPKIDQQIQRSPGSVKHEHINLISFGNQKKTQQSIFCTIPNKNLLMLFSQTYLYLKRKRTAAKNQAINVPFLAISCKHRNNRKCDFISNMQSVVICRYLYRALSKMESEMDF